MSQRKNALRLTFSYEDGVLQLTSQDEVDMMLPAGDAPVSGPEQGFWAELRDTSNQTVFRRILHNPMPDDMEVFSDQPDKNIARVPRSQSRGMFTIVVPNHDRAASLTLFSSYHEVAPRPAQPPHSLSRVLPFHAVRALTKRPEAAREIARFDLKARG